MPATRTSPSPSTRPPRKPPVRRRGPGRPAPGDADLRERLLDAALQVFCAEGIRAASLKSIAAQAGVTPALVHYYFGSKDALQAAVVEERFLPVAASLRGVLGDPSQPVRALIAGFVDGVHALVERHPWLPVIWVREILTEGGALRETLLSRVAPAVPQVLAERFAQAQREGAINAALDPRFLVVSLIGLTLFPLAAEGIWRRVFPDGALDHARLRAHTLALLACGLEVRDGPT
jgi:AcrR family transcriptional regulator